MKRKIGVLLISLLLSIIIVLVVNNEFKVEAAGGGGSNGTGEDNGISLDLDYMYNVTLDLASVVHNDSIWGTGIRKGRDFGTEGDRWTADYIKAKLEKLNLENVTKIKIEPIDGKDCWKYNYKVDVVDFNLIINGDGYIHPHTVPKNETYAMPTGCKNWLRPITRPGFGDMDRLLKN